MDDPYLQEVVNGRRVAVKLVPGTAQVEIFVGTPSPLFEPPYVDVQPYLDAGLSEREVLERVMELAATTVRVAFKER